MYDKSMPIKVAMGGMLPFKTQINIYNECLGKVQGYTPSEAYILSRGWFTESRINNRIIKQ